MANKDLHNQIHQNDVPVSLLYKSSQVKSSSLICPNYLIKSTVLSLNVLNKTKQNIFPFLVNVSSTH